MQDLAGPPQGLLLQQWLDLPPAFQCAWPTAGSRGEARQGAGRAVRTGHRRFERTSSKRCHKEVEKLKTDKLWINLESSF